MDIRELSAFVLAFCKRYPYEHGTVLHALLAIADRPGVTTLELRRILGISQPATSRNVGILGEGHVSGGVFVKGFGLVSAFPNVHDNRTQTVMLSRKGKKVLAELLEEAGIA